MKVELKLKKKHPRNCFKIGKHSIGTVFASYDLDETEMKELKTVGPQSWVEIKGKSKKAPAEKTKPTQKEN